jgi:Molybdopterin-binding domain of aldehyde dehydrogenase
VPGYDSARVVFEEAGTFTVYISSAEAGQQHAAVCRRQVAAVLGVDLRLVRVVEGDTAACPVGSETFASRFAVKQITAALAGASRMAERLRLAAASYLGCSSGEVRRAEGGYEHPASGGQVSLAKLGEWLYRPPGATPVQSSGVPVEELGYADGEAALSCGALLTVVEVDPQSFVTKVRAMSVVEECGRVLDHDLAMGQLVGGAVMGLGDALLEEHLYDDLGQITTSSLMDYLLPSFGDAPRIKVSLLEDESLYTEQGAGDGCGGHVWRDWLAGLVRPAWLPPGLAAIASWAPACRLARRRAEMTSSAGCEAIARHQAAIGAARHLGDRLGQAGALNDLGVVRSLTDDYPAAAQDLEQALDIYHDLGNRNSEAETLNESATLARVGGDLARAQECHRHALDLARAIASPWNEAHALADLGRCALAAGHATQATGLLHQALEIFQRIGAAEAPDLRAELDALTGPPPAR